MAKFCVWVAGYGPKALRTAAPIGDGVISRLPTPTSSPGPRLSAKAQERSRPRLSKIGVMARRPVWAYDEYKKLPGTRPLVPAPGSTTCGPDLQIKNPRKNCLAALTSFRVKDRRQVRLSPSTAKSASDNAEFVTDEVSTAYDSSAPIDEHRKKLDRLRKVGEPSSTIEPNVRRERRKNLDRLSHKNPCAPL